MKKILIECPHCGYKCLESINRLVSKPEIVEYNNINRDELEDDTFYFFRCISCQSISIMSRKDFKIVNIDDEGYHTVED